MSPPSRMTQSWTSRWALWPEATPRRRTDHHYCCFAGADVADAATHASDGRCHHRRGRCLHCNETWCDSRRWRGCNCYGTDDAAPMLAVAGGYARTTPPVWPQASAVGHPAGSPALASVIQQLVNGALSDLTSKAYQKVLPGSMISVAHIFI